MDKFYFATKWIYKQATWEYWIVTDSLDKEYFIFKRDRLNAFPWDLVEIKIKKLEDSKKKAEAVITNIISRSSEPIIGVFIKRKWQDFAFVRAYNTFAWKDIFVFGNDFSGAINNDIVLVRITKWKDKPVWVISEIIWKNTDLDIFEKITLLQNKVRTIFPSDVLLEAKNLKEINISHAREDLRSEIIVTIDWEDAKDLDDAINVKVLSNGNYELWVHIADVAEYVKYWSKLDQEAYIRWTSIYLPWEVIPMLPSEISNNLCSLNTSWDKATLSIIVEIDKNNWKVLKSKVIESIIKSKARLTYNEVWDFLSKKQNSSQINKNLELQEMLLNANKLFKIIYSRRKKEGKIEFEFPEVKIEVDEKKSPIRIFKQIRNDAHRIIEEFMIIANEEISKFFSEKKIPFLYRIHEAPSQDSISVLKKVLEEHSIFIDENNISSLIINQIINDLKWRKEEYLLSKQILQAMSKAKYSYKILWHFWLSLKYYSHFTSPIRRYPDLQIHRIIKEYLNWKLDRSMLDKYKNILDKVANNCSATEQKAEEVERKITFLKTIEYASKFIWEIFDSRVSWITNNWIYCELESGIEWFISLRLFKNTYRYIEEKKCFENINNGKKIILWDKLKIKIIKADKSRGFLDFDMIKQ